MGIKITENERLNARKSMTERAIANKRGGASTDVVVGNEVRGTRYE